MSFDAKAILDISVCHNDHNKSIFLDVALCSAPV